MIRSQRRIFKAGFIAAKGESLARRRRRKSLRRLNLQPLEQRCLLAGDVVFVSGDTGGAVGGISFDNEDILAYETTTGQWSLYFDGSQVGLTPYDVDAFHVQDDGRILLSVESAIPNLSTLGRVEDSDIIRFTPTGHGIHTAGSFDWYLDGSDVGLDTGFEDINAIAFDPSARLVISTRNNYDVPNASGSGSDLLVFDDAGSLGASSVGTWETYFDGSDIGLPTQTVYGASIDGSAATPTIHLTTKENFSISSGTSLSGDINDIFSCHTTSLGDTTGCSAITLLIDMDSVGFVAQNLDGIQVGDFTGNEVFGDQNIYLSSDFDGVIGGVLFAEADIIVQDTSTAAWSLFFDGSDVGIVGDVNAFHREPSGTILMSFKETLTLPGFGNVEPQDVVRFHPFTLGSDTAGTFSPFLDGSTVGLDTPFENIDAIAVDPASGDLVISTTGVFDLPAAVGNISGTDRDLIRHHDLTGNWGVFLEGAPIGLNSTSEDITGAWLDPDSGDTLINTLGTVTVPGVSGTLADILRIDSSGNATKFYDGQATEIGAQAIDGIFIQDQNFTPQPVSVLIIDDSEPGFSQQGTWPLIGRNGRNGGFRYANSGTGNNIARWTFNGLTPGQYRVSAAYRAWTNRSTEAPFNIRDGSTPIATVLVDQTQPAADVFDTGTKFHDLGNFSISGTQLVVELSDATPGVVVADAIRIELLGALAPGPEIHVTADNAAVDDDTGIVNFGNVEINTTVIKPITVKNLGTNNVSLSPAISLPPGFTLDSGFGATTLVPGASTTFQVQIDTSTLGPLAGGVSFVNNDPDENPFNFTIQGNVVPFAGIQIIDDGEPGFSTVGNFPTIGRNGFQGDFQYATAGSGSKQARWTFTVAPASDYRVSVAWHEHTNRATDAPFTIYDGLVPLTTIDVDQTMSPNPDFLAGPTPFDVFHDLGTFTISGGQLIVELSNDADGAVIADAVRIERLGP